MFIRRMRRSSGCGCARVRVRTGTGTGAYGCWPRDRVSIRIAKLRRTGLCGGGSCVFSRMQTEHCFDKYVPDGKMERSCTRTDPAKLRRTGSCGGGCCVSWPNADRAPFDKYVLDGKVGMERICARGGAAIAPASDDRSKKMACPDVRDACWGMPPVHALLLLTVVRVVGFGLSRYRMKKNGTTRRL